MFFLFKLVTQRSINRIGKSAQPQNSTKWKKATSFSHSMLREENPHSTEKKRELADNEPLIK